MCAVVVQPEIVRSTSLLAIRLVIEDVLDGEEVAGHIVNAAMRAVVLPAKIKVIADALLKDDGLMAPIAIFGWN